jgi:hypothetical protein
MKHLFFLLLVVLIVSACGSSQQTHTSASPTKIQEDVIITGEVTFNGNECFYAGPTELQTGKYSFILDDTSEMNLKNFGLWVIRFEEGKTLQDIINLQEEPGDDTKRPIWAPHTPYYSVDRIIWTYTLDKAGEHAFDVGGFPPSRVWFCTPPFQVVEAPSG